MTLEDKINSLPKPIKLALLAVPAIGATVLKSPLPSGLVAEKTQELWRAAKQYGHYGIEPIIYMFALGSGWKSNFNCAVGAAVAGWAYKMCTWAITPGADIEHYFKRGCEIGLAAAGFAVGGKVIDYLAKKK